MSFAKLITTIRQNQIPLDEERLKLAFDFAATAHAGQVRQTGEPYINHPLAVAITLANWRQNQTTIEAALLHDILDETSITRELLKSTFDEEITFLVDGVSQIGRVRLRGSTNKIFTENLRKMFVAMAKDIRVILIRLADRLHNMQTLDAVPLAKQKRIAQETLEIYAPLAERLGIGQLKGDLEDLAFPFLYPEEYHQIIKVSSGYYHNAEKSTESAIQLIKEKLWSNGIIAEVHGRHKRKYSLFKKLSRPEIGGDINKIHDLIALRIITNSKTDCYIVLGLVHDLWRPVPYLGVSDFIAQPKPNGYQSIHTKVFDNKGNFIEIQVRTSQMHEQAEFGAAAHTFYDLAKTSGASSEKLEKGTAFKVPGKIDWIKQLATASFLRLDALAERIYVFSPKGDVYDLPKDATPVDFAFVVHTDLGLHIQGAKVNQKIVPLSQTLKSGDMVEIIKSKEKHTPNRDWLQFVKTSKARGKIGRFWKSSAN